MGLHTPLPFRCTDGLDYVGVHYPAHKNNIYIDCPWCGGKKKLNVVLSGNKEHLFHCAKCDTSANTIIYVAEVRGISSKEAYAEVCNYANVPLYEKETLQKPATVKKLEQPKEETVELLPIKERNKTYRYLLAGFTLEDEDKQGLLKRGFSEEAIEKLGYKTYKVGDYKEGSKIAKILSGRGLSLEGTPGFYTYNKVWNLMAFEPSITICYRDYNARIQGMQLRFRNKKEPRYLWLSSAKKFGGPFDKGCGGSFLHFATDFTWNEEKGINEAVLGETVVLTEGALKADLFHFLTGVPCLAVPGVNSYKCFEDIISILKEKGVKKIILAFYMDYIDKKEVQKAEAKIKEIIVTNEFQFVRAKWDPQFKGIDNYYAFKKKGIK